MDKKQLYRRLILKSTSTPVMTKDELTQITRITEYVYLGSYNNAMALESSGVPFRYVCLLYTSPSPRDVEESRMPSSA